MVYGRTQQSRRISSGPAEDEDANVATPGAVEACDLLLSSAVMKRAMIGVQGPQWCCWGAA